MALPKITFAGSGERGQYLTHKANDTIIHFVLNYPEIVDADVLRAATKALVESVDVLHSTFFVDPNVAYLPLVTLLLSIYPDHEARPPLIMSGGFVLVDQS